MRAMMQLTGRHSYGARSVNERPFYVLLSQRHRRKSGVKWTCANDDDSDCDDCGLGLGGLCLLTYSVK